MSAAAMTPERWRAVDAILQAALALEPAQRPAFVAEACGEDAALRQEVESLLAAAPDEDFLEQPAVAVPDESTARDRLAAALAGRFVIERELGRGGMATVYLAQDVRHGRRVALKVLRPQLAAAVGEDRFLKEIALTASLQHPHILPLFDSGSAAGALWYAMPYVAGETLRARLAREGRLPIEEATRLAREIAGALEYAHARGIVHRDVKPENILLMDGHALVADFGIALALEQAGGDRITQTGLTLGTPQYMAPEQAQGERRVDARADVYALGAVLHEMVAGQQPFAGPSPQAVIRRVLHEAPAPLVPLRRDVPPWLDAAVRRALEKRPGDRFASARAFAEALAPAPVNYQAPYVAPEPIYYPMPERRGPRGIAVGTVALIALAAVMAGTGFGWWLARGPVGWLAFGRPIVETPRVVRPTVDAVMRRVQPPIDNLSLDVVDRSGNRVKTLAAQRPWTPRFSPDGTRIAYGTFADGNQSSDVWVTELATGATTRLTSGSDDANDPQWSPDGKTIAYSVNAPGGKDLVVQRVGDAAARPLVVRDGQQFTSDWTHDGREVLFIDQMNGSRDLMAQPVNGGPARPVVATPANETAGRLSADGKWLAYTSDIGGRDEVWLQRWDGTGQAVRVSTEGGRHPVWRRDGKELYYWHDQELIAATLQAEHGTLTVTTRATLLRADYAGDVTTMYDVSPDGKTFVIVERR